MKKRRLYLWIIGAILVSLACNFPTPRPPELATATVAVPTATTAPAVTNTPFVLPSPTAALVTPVQTPTEEKCVPNAGYVADVTIPDDTKMEKGEDFTKTWRIENIGNCAWEQGTKFVHISGNAMSAPTSIAVPATKPGEEIEVSVKMTAPATPGSYKSDWQLQSPDGNRYGHIFYVRIVVKQDPPTPTPTPTLPGNFAGVVTTDCVSVTFKWDDVTGESGYRLEGPELNKKLPADTIQYTWDDPVIGNYVVTLVVLGKDDAQIGRVSTTIDVDCEDVARPDLVVQSLEFTPGTPKANQSLNVKVTVKNQGDVESSSFTIYWWGNTDFAEPSCEWRVSGILAKDETVTLACDDFQYEKAYENIVTKVEADVKNTIAENNEDNNVLERTINVVE